MNIPHLLSQHDHLLRYTQQLNLSYALEFNQTLGLKSILLDMKLIVEGNILNSDIP